MGAPVSTRVLRAEMTAGHPPLMPWSTALPGSKPSCTTVNFTTPLPPSSMSNATFERGSAPHSAARALSMPCAAAHSGVKVCHV